MIRPGADWAGHVPGQYVRIGIDVDGVRQWRAYSLTHGPRADGRISITVKAVPDGKVSNHLVHEARPARWSTSSRRPASSCSPPERRQAPVRHRRLRHHAGHRDAAQPVPGHRRGRRSACRAARPTTSSSCTSRPAEPDSIFTATSSARTTPARSGSSRGTTTSTASSTSPTWPTWCPTSPSARRSPAGRPGSSTPSSAHHDERGLAAVHRAVPHRARRRRRRRHGHLRPTGTAVEADGATPDPRRRRGRRGADAERLPDGHLLRLRAAAAARAASATCATATITTAVPGERRHQGADLHQRRRRPVPHRPLDRRPYASHEGGSHDHDPEEARQPRSPTSRPRTSSRSASSSTPSARRSSTAAAPRRGVHPDT